MAARWCAADVLQPDRSEIQTTEVVTTTGLKRLQNAFEHNITQVNRARIEPTMSATRDEVFVCSPTYKMIGVSLLLLQPAVNR
jgi:hypothetical protein